MVPTVRDSDRRAAGEGQRVAPQLAHPAAAVGALEAAEVEALGVEEGAPEQVAERHEGQVADRGGDAGDDEELGGQRQLPPRGRRRPSRLVGSVRSSARTGGLVSVIAEKAPRSRCSVTVGGARDGQAGGGPPGRDGRTAPRNAAPSRRGSPERLGAREQLVVLRAPLVALFEQPLAVDRRQLVARRGSPPSTIAGVSSRSAMTCWPSSSSQSMNSIAVAGFSAFFMQLPPLGRAMTGLDVAAGSRRVRRRSWPPRRCRCSSTPRRRTGRRSSARPCTVWPLTTTAPSTMSVKSLSTSSWLLPSVQPESVSPGTSRSHRARGPAGRRTWGRRGPPTRSGPGRRMTGRCSSSARRC